MFRGFLKDIKKQNGEVMLEASIILVSVIILLMVMLSLSFMFYQEAMMTSVANEIAADIAKNYKLPTLDIGDNEPKIGDIESVKMYRLSFGVNKLENLHEERAEDYAEWRIKLATLGLNPGDVDVKCEIIRSGIGRAYAKVTVKQTTDFFLSGILDYTGITEKNTAFGATAYAECNDFMGYTSLINFTRYLTGMPDTAGLQPIAELYQSMKGFIEVLKR